VRSSAKAATEKEKISANQNDRVILEGEPTTPTRRYFNSIRSSPRIPAHDPMSECVTRKDQEQDQDHEQDSRPRLPQFHLRLRDPVRNGSLRQPAWRNWQTRWTQNPVLARVCGFEPLRRHSPRPSLTRRPGLPSTDRLGLPILEILEAETARSLGDLGVRRIGFRPMSGQMAADLLRNPDQ
jgi:hypothetical protein